MTTLSSYKLMWMIVFFDLPVITPAERKTASGFRKFLLDQGFHMSQFSVYYRLLSGKEALNGYIGDMRWNEMFYPPYLPSTCITLAVVKISVFVLSDELLPVTHTMSRRSMFPEYFCPAISINRT